MPVPYTITNDVNTKIHNRFVSLQYDAAERVGFIEFAIKDDSNIRWLGVERELAEFGLELMPYEDDVPYYTNVDTICYNVLPLKESA